MLRHSPLGLVLAALALAVAGTDGFAGGKLNPVKVQAVAGKPDASGKQTVTIDITIDKTWHIYANPVKNDELADAQTTIRFKADGKNLPAVVAYPTGTKHTDKAIGTCNVYEDRVTIKAQVQRATGDNSPLDVSVEYQACDGGKCLPPKTVKLSLK